jgi:endoglucanase
VNHWFWANEIDKSFPKAPDGVVSGGPAVAMNYYDKYASALGLTYNHGDYINACQRCYVDSAESEITNGTSLSRNASLAWVTSFLQDIYAEKKPPFEKVCGDVNCDGKIDVTDLSTLALTLVDKEELTGKKAYNADTDGDGKVTLADLATLRQYLSKIITEFPVD